MSARAHVSRRSAVTSAALAPLLLSACDIDPPPRDTGSGPAEPAPPEDSELVASVVSATVDTAALVSVVSQSFPELTTGLTSLSQAHAAHIATLVGALRDTERPTATPTAVPARATPALAAVRRSEQRLLRTLRESCLAASSGDLARVLASMSASISQHCATLTETSR